MITIESDRAPGAVQTIAAEVLGYTPGVSVAGRLGTEISLASVDRDTLTELRSALTAGGHQVIVTDDQVIDSRGVAKMLGIAVGSVARYRNRGDLPEPDLMLGRSPGWYRTTIEAWQQTRPGRGSGGGRPRRG